MSLDAAKIATEVNTLKTEVINTQAQLEQIKNKGSIWSEAGRQAIVSECLKVVEPKMDKFVPIFSRVTDSLKALPGAPEVDRLKAEFKTLLATIAEALKGMAKYGNPADKEKVAQLDSKLLASTSKLG